MRELSFDTGLVSYTIKGKDSDGNIVSSFNVLFNPADEAFFNRLFDSLETLDSAMKEYRDNTENADFKERFEHARNRDKKIEETVDSVFKDKVSKNAFDAVSPCALANGFPVWMNIAVAVMDEILENLSEEEKRVNDRVAKYTDKYKKKYHK